MTDADTVGVGADSIAALPSKKDSHVMYNIEATLDIDDMAAKGYSVQTEMFPTSRNTSRSTRT